MIQKCFNLLGYRVERFRDPEHRPREVVKAHYYGRAFHCFKNETLADHILAGKVWDPQLSGILTAAKPGHVVEIGANIGASFVPIARSYEHLHFHCVEPVPDFYDLLKRNIKEYAPPNVSSYHEACSDREGKPIEIFVGLGTAGQSDLVHYQQDHGSLSRAAKTVDTLFADVPVTLLKIDVDGFEQDVLKGAVQTIRQYRPMLFLEFAIKVVRDLQESPEELGAWLAEAGYQLKTVWDSEGRVLPTPENWQGLLDIAAQQTHHLDLLLTQE